jgi:hypothetical protein
MVQNNIATGAATMFVGGSAAVGTKLLINSTIQLSVNGRNADFADIGINSFSPYTYGNQWGTAGVDWKPLSGDLMPKVAFINKAPASVMLDVGMNHLYYGLGKLPVTQTPLSSNQKLLLGTTFSASKAVIKKVYNDGLFGSTQRAAVDNTGVYHNPAPTNR